MANLAEERAWERRNKKQKMKEMAYKVGQGRDATKSKHWGEFVNHYRAHHGSNAGLDSARVRTMSDKELRRSIDSFKSYPKK